MKLTCRSVLFGIGGAAPAGAFREARAQADTRLFGHGSVIESSVGPLGFAVAGDGPPLMM
jgi:hypothetical protein